jgi:hypothetical protein
VWEVTFASVPLIESARAVKAVGGSHGGGLVFDEWVLAEGNQELAAHEVRAARLRSAGCEAKPTVPRADEDRWGRRRVGDVAATGVGVMVGTLAAGLTLVGAPRIRKHWRRPDGRCAIKRNHAEQRGDEMTTPDYTVQRFILAIGLAAAVVAGAGPAVAVEIGEEAPDFSLTATTGGKLNLSQFRGKQPVLIEFYSADFAPV